MDSIQQYLRQKLQERQSENRYRRLFNSSDMVDFCSNDYLGFARSADLKRKIAEEQARHPEQPIGATGSRLLTGNSHYAQHLEEEIALFHHAEAGLLFNSGYAANTGLLAAVARRGDTVICDEQAHASIMDGIRLSNANRYCFRHNDTTALEQKLQQAQKGNGQIFIVIESIYSMDGDLAPLDQIAFLAEHYDAALIVDEAHALGVFGRNGRGRIPQAGLEERVFARLYTFGKALGSHGAIVVGSRTLKNYLINFARPLIYSTALPFHSLAGIKAAYELLIGRPGLQQELAQKTVLLKQLLQDSSEGQVISRLLPSEGPIQSLIIPGNQAVRQAAAQLQAAGMDVRPILSPTVAAGTERLRICLHLFNSEQEIKRLALALKSLG